MGITGTAEHAAWQDRALPPVEQQRPGLCSRIFAVTETDAHLRLLAGRGLVTGSAGTVPTWTLAVR